MTKDGDEKLTVHRLDQPDARPFVRPKGVYNELVAFNSLVGKITTTAVVLNQPLDVGEGEVVEVDTGYTLVGIHAGHEDEW